MAVVIQNNAQWYYHEGQRPIVDVTVSWVRYPVLDIFWYSCNFCEQVTGILQWCKHIAETFLLADDWSKQMTGVVPLPIMPTKGIWATVTLNAFPEQSIVVYTRELLSNFAWQTDGLLPGETLAVVRDVFLDYVRSQVAPDDLAGTGEIVSRCPSSTHVPNRQVHMQFYSEQDKVYRYRNLLYLVLERACIPCLENLSSNALGPGVPDTSTPDDMAELNDAMSARGNRSR